MLVIYKGQKKDMHHTIATKLLKSGEAKLVPEKEVVKRTRKKIVKDE
jgi:hypothetical protein